MDKPNLTMRFRTRKAEKNLTMNKLFLRQIRRRKLSLLTYQCPPYLSAAMDFEHLIRFQAAIKRI